MFDYLLSEEQLVLRDEVRQFVKSIPSQMILDMDADKIRFPKEFLREAGRRNLFGCRYPVKWGGRGADWVTASVVIEEIGTLGYIFACTFGVGAELVCDAIMIHGNDAQKEKYVRPLLKGELFAAECLTEPRGGSDFFGATTTAVDRGDHFLLNGQKRFIVGGEGADYFLVYARTDPKAEPHRGISALIVDRSPGVETPYLYGLMGCRGGGTSRVVFKDVKVPKENVLGRLHGGAEVFKTMMIPERLGTAAMTIGAARPALEIATDYSSRRQAFGRAIREFQGVSFQVAEATTLLDTSRAMVHVTSQAVDKMTQWNRSNQRQRRVEGEAPTALPVEGATRAPVIDEKRVRRMVSETKKFVTESCQKVVHNAMQVMGGIGYTNVFPIERIHRDLRLSSIWTGTNEIMSAIIAEEWYKERAKSKSTTNTRDCEMDAPGSGETAEKDYGSP